MKFRFHTCLGILSFGISLLAPSFSSANQKDLQVYVQELEAYDYYLKFKDVKARNLIREVLKKNPKSPVSYFVLGLLTREDEGNTTQALHYFKKSIQFAEEQCGKAPLTPRCVKWHSLAFQEKIQALKSLDRPEEALENILHYDTLYNPKLDTDKIWPLIKLRKLDKAEALTKKILLEGQSYNKITGLNSLCVIASERNQRIESEKVCEEASNKTKSMVLHYNTAISKFSVFDHEGAERVARKGSLLPNDMYGTIWEILIYQYTLETRFSEALSASKQASNEHKGFGGLKEELSRAHFLNAISQLLLALGKTEDAFRLATESHDLPDRTGKISGNPQFDKLMNDAYYHIVLKLYESYLLELNPHLSIKEKFFNTLKYMEVRFTRYTIRRKIKKLLQEKSLLVKLVTPYPASLGPLETLPFWLSGSLIEIVGGGVFEEAIGKAKANETEILEKSEPYYLAASAQKAFFSQDYKTALILSTKASNSLPVQERLLKDLLKTIIAYCNGKLGKQKTMRNQYIELIRSTPTFFRYFDIRLPVTFHVEAGPYSNAALKLLQKNPRLKKDDGGIPLSIRSTKDAIGLCLMDDFNSVIFCRQGKIDPKDKARHLTLENGVHQFIQDTFSPKIDLSQLDVNTLNGVPTKGTGSEAIKDLLKKHK